jgi:mannose-6-phosphate isomerase-like protein (cupin superfamily)
MIVTTVAATVRTMNGTVGRTHSRSLARRGFFFSETEAFDYLRLAPGAEIDARGRRGTEEAWFVVSGDGELVDSTGLARPLHRDNLVSCPLDSRTRLRAGTRGMEVLLLAVIPKQLSAVLPARLPSEPAASAGARS